MLKHQNKLNQDKPHSFAQGEDMRLFLLLQLLVKSMKDLGL